MIRFFFLSVLGVGLSCALSAQCDKCTQVENFTSDYCFTSDLLPGKCAQFSLQKDHFYYQAKDKKAPVKVQLGPVGEMEYLLGLAEQKSLKLKAADAIFLAEAFKNWQTESMDLRVSLYSEGVYNAEQLAAFPFTETETGLGIHILEQGQGSLPANGKNVTVHYRGYLTDGNIFDASYKRGQPFNFPLGMGRVIKGWDEGIAKLPIGTRALLKLPPNLGYGARSTGSIPANSTLIFDVFVIDSK